MTLPDPPAGLRECFARGFPDIADRALTRADVVRIIGEAKVLHRIQARCGDRAVTWIEKVRAAYAR